MKICPVLIESFLVVCLAWPTVGCDDRVFTVKGEAEQSDKVAVTEVDASVKSPDEDDADEDDGPTLLSTTQFNTIDRTKPKTPQLYLPPGAIRGSQAVSLIVIPEDEGNRWFESADKRIVIPEKAKGIFAKVILGNPGERILIADDFHILIPEENILIPEENDILIDENQILILDPAKNFIKNDRLIKRFIEISSQSYRAVFALFDPTSTIVGGPARVATIGYSEGILDCPFAAEQFSGMTLEGGGALVVGLFAIEGGSLTVGGVEQLDLPTSINAEQEPPGPEEEDDPKKSDPNLSDPPIFNDPAVGPNGNKNGDPASTEAFITNEWIAIPAGTFTMGSDLSPELDSQPAHFVTMSKFSILKFEVSSAEYRRCLDSGKCDSVLDEAVDRTLDVAGKENHPINYIDWLEARTYCRWIGGDLPTEAEWEYAARGISPIEFPWGDDFKLSGVVPANCSEDSCSDGFAATAPVGSFPDGVSPFGCQDMAGNVWEWVRDTSQRDYRSCPSGCSDPFYESDSETKVSRGGGYKSMKADIFSYERDGFAGTFRDSTLGFRCVRQ